MRRMMGPLRDVVGALAKRDHPLVADRTAPYFRDVYDHLIRTHEGVDAARDRLGNAMDAYLSMASNRTNEIMKRLTLMSAIFLPLTFVTGFFGQNFANLPFDSILLFIAMLMSCAGIPAAMIVWFSRRRWL
jgi:magnesium transporter